MKGICMTHSGLAFIVAMFCVAPAVAQPVVVRFSTYARMPSILGRPEAGFVDLYEFDMWMNEIGPSEGHVRRCGAPPYEATTHDGSAPFDVLPGTYAILLHQPEWFVRPAVVPNVVIKAEGAPPRNIMPPLDYACVSGTKLGAWEKQGFPEPWESAEVFHQSFRARGTSITHAHYKVAGAKAKSARLSIHKVRDDAPPKEWPQVGPERVDAKVGTLNDNWVGWRSGEIVTVPGELYALRIEGLSDGTAADMAMVVHRDAIGPGYEQGTAYANGIKQAYDIYGSISSDSDGTVIPYMRIFDIKPGEHGGGGSWAQSWVAQGRSLAAVDFLVAWSQDMRVAKAEARIHENDPAGKLIGTPKRMYAAWWAPGCGFLGAAWQPGEVQLEPGRTYCVEFRATAPCRGYSGGLVNHPENAYPNGMAFRDGKPQPDKDLEMTIVEYAKAAPAPKLPVTGCSPEAANLLTNGDFEKGAPNQSNDYDPPGWKRWKSRDTAFWFGTYGRDGSQAARVIGGSINDTRIDGGYVQRVAGLDGRKTYCLTGWTSSSAQTDQRYLSAVGYDPTGQTDNPQATTIIWEGTGRRSTSFEQVTIRQIRPKAGVVSIWTRAMNRDVGDQTFTVDFDDFRLVEKEKD